VTISTLRRFCAAISIFIVVLCACKTQTQAATKPAQAQTTPAPTPLTTLDGAQGGKIVYGTVDGASTQAEAMSKVLRIVHDNCGDKPQIGKVFQFKGTHTVGVFFQVTNHPQGNVPVAGLVISAASGPHQVEAALVSDKASRFGQTVNPMLEQLFGVWHPGGQAAASSTAFHANDGDSQAGPATLRQIMLPDRSASAGIPSGWQVDPDSGGGTMQVRGPNKEIIFLNSTFGAFDPRDPSVPQGIMLQRQYGRGAPDNKVYLPYGVNLPQAFVTLFHDAQQRAHFPLSTIQMSNTSQIPGQPCDRLEGTMTGGPLQGPNQFFGVFCEQPPQAGMWLSSLTIALLPDSVAAQEHATAGAIMASFQMNQAVVQQQANTIAAPTIAVIQQVGRDATARYNATQAANDAQHAAYWDRQDSNARNSQSFSNYLLDQTVVQDNNMYGNGTIGHSTEWNSTADALVKADPNRFETVDTPNYWKGTDY
jgi:hypothetical protein